MAKSQINMMLSCPIDKVWATVTDLEHFAWRSDLKDIEIIDNANFIEVTKSGIETHFQTTKLEARKSWEFDMENDSIKGHWTGSFTPQGQQTLVNFTENVTAKKILLRPLIGSYLRRQQKQYLKDLRQELEVGNKS